MKILGPLLLCGIGALAATAQAVDKGEIKIEGRWSVVGVIAGSGAAGEPIGIAVLRNNQSKRTYTLSIGDSIPTEYGFVLEAVEGRSVRISDGRKSVALSFAEGTGDSDAEATSHTARFIDNYYRSIGDGGAQAFGDEAPGTSAAETADAVDAATGGFIPLKRFGNLRDEGESRFDLYRADRTYRFESGDGDEGDGGIDGGFVVNYDNFAEDPESEVESERSGPPTTTE